MDLSPHTLSEALEESWATAKNDVGEKVRLNIFIAFVYRIVAVEMDAF
jgi:hypothetical protein